MKRLNLLRMLCISMAIGALALSNGLVYAASDKENQGNHGQGNNGQGNNGQGNQGQGQGKGRSDSAPGQSQAGNNSQAASHTSNSDNSEVRKNAIERGRDQANLRATRPEKTNQAIGKNHEKGTGVRRALEKARWSYHPKDQRGQGNMGKVDMRDPYGFDKDSGREGSERGRAIHPEPILDLALLLMIDWQIPDIYLRFLYSQLNYWLAAAANPTDWYQSRYASWFINYWQSRINNYTPPAYDKIPTNLDVPIEYAMTIDTPEGFEGTTLLITTTLTSINDYTETFSFVDWSRRAVAGEPNYYGWPIVTVTYHFDAGQVAVQTTEEVTLGEDNTYTFSYEPVDTYYTPDTLVGSAGNYFELAVTVTDPASGATYTQTYDRQLYLYRCPYGKVSDTKTGQPIVGAKVSVHFEDGALVPLDKAANPTANNPQTTDATGRFGFKLETNRKYYISVAAPGYQEYKSPLFTEKWHVLREDIKLIPIK